MKRQIIWGLCVYNCTYKRMFVSYLLLHFSMDFYEVWFTGIYMEFCIESLKKVRKNLESGKKSGLLCSPKSLILRRPLRRQLISQKKELWKVKINYLFLGSDTERIPQSRTASRIKYIFVFVQDKLGWNFFRINLLKTSSGFDI